MERMIVGLSALSLLCVACDANLTAPPVERSSDLGPHEPGVNGPPTEEEPTVATEPVLPGFSVIRRLNRLEYQNTVVDLLGTQLDISETLPADNLGEEFATIGAALSLSPVGVLAYERAADELIAELFSSESDAAVALRSCDAGDLEGLEPDVARECAAEIIRTFTTRAFRRNVTEEEIETLLGPYDTAVTWNASRTDGLRGSFTAVLLSPHFLFRVETDETPDSAEARPLTSTEVASRLSYTLWATMPDEQLLNRALADDLTTPAAVGEEITRMLADDRAQGFLENFAAAWLGYSHLDEHEVEETAFPEFSPELADSMMREANQFVGHFLDTGKPLQEMLSAEFSFVDARLSEHYGLPAPDAAEGELVQVSTSGYDRRGLLTLGAILMHTSFSTRTSPVRRGEYLFARFLCGEIPPPPPGVEGLTVDVEGLSMRERLELHRQDPSCNACHAVMDPLGLGLESYDAIGAFRTQEAGSTIDPSGTLPDGRSFAGAMDLATILSEDERFSECVAQKFMSYSLGRIVHHNDGWLKYLYQELPSDAPSLSEVVTQVLTSRAFLTRQAGPLEP